MTLFQGFAVMASSLISLITTTLAFRFTRSMLEREKRIESLMALADDLRIDLDAAEGALRAVRRAAGSSTKSSSE